MQKITLKKSQNVSFQNKVANKDFEKKKNEIEHKVYVTASSFAPAVPVFFAHNFFTNSIFKKMVGVAKSLNEEEIKALNIGADKVLKKSKLENLIEIKDITSKTNISNFLQPPLTIQNLQQVQQGENAFFNGLNQVFVNMQGPIYRIFFFSFVHWSICFFPCH